MQISWTNIQIQILRKLRAPPNKSTQKKCPPQNLRDRSWNSIDCQVFRFWEAAKSCVTISWLCSLWYRGRKWFIRIFYQTPLISCSCYVEGSNHLPRTVGVAFYSVLLQKHYFLLVRTPCITWLNSIWQRAMIRWRFRLNSCTACFMSCGESLPCCETPASYPITMRFFTNGEHT